MRKLCDLIKIIYQLNKLNWLKSFNLFGSKAAWNFKSKSLEKKFKNLLRAKISSELLWHSNKNSC